MGSTAHKILKVSFKKCPITNRKQVFSQSKCIMPISVGQKIHEGEKLLATLKLINASFKECTLLIDDSIQRHTLKIMDNDSQDNLYRKALREGDLWLARNKPTYEQLTIPYIILRWDNWLQHPYFPIWHKMIQNLYLTNKTYQEAMRASIEAFLSRYVKRLGGENINYEKAFTCCLDYLQEECTVMCLWAKEKYDFEVYPSGRNAAMVVAYEQLIKPFYPNILQSVSLHFRKHFTKNVI